MLRAHPPATDITRFRDGRMSKRDRVLAKAQAKAIKKLVKLGGPADVQYAVAGFSDKRRNSGVLYLTNTAIGFISKKTATSSPELFPLDTVRNVGVETSLVMGEVKVMTASETFKVDHITKAEALAFVKAYKGD